jgi:molybdopterin-guanine dinucleotide biosynthesis protein B
MVVLVAAIGISGSGKTTTIEFLISSLTKMGYKVGAIKHIHRENFTIDREGTNTWRFSKAGSKITVAISPDEIAIIEKTTGVIQNLDKIIKQLENEHLDIIFIEGFHGYISQREDIKKIITAKTKEDLDTTLNNSVPPILAITGLIAKNNPQRTKIPYLDLPDEGAQLIEIVRKHLTASNNKQNRAN